MEDRELSPMERERRDKVAMDYETKRWKRIQGATGVRRVRQVRSIENDGSISVAPDQWHDDSDGTHALLPWPEHQAMVRMIETVAGSGVEFSDERVGYVSVQIDADVWREISALGRARKEE